MATARFGQQDKISDAKEILTLISRDLRANTGQGAQHNPLTLTACVSNMFDINTAQELTIDEAITNKGDLFTVNTSCIVSLPIGNQFTFIQPDTGASPAYTACPNVGDGASAYFGNDQNAAMGYDEAGDDQFVVTGASWFFNGPQVNIGTTVGGGGEPLAVRIDQNAETAIEAVNADATAAAAAFYRAKNTAGIGSTHAIEMGVLGTGFTTSAPAYQDGGLIQTGANLSGGLTIRTIADVPIYFAVNSTTEVCRASSDGLTIVDDIYLNLGTDLDTRMRYDEAGDDNTKVSGADWLFDSLIVNVGTAVGGGGEPLAVRVDQNSETATEVVNADGGAAAGAFMRTKIVAGSGSTEAFEFGALGQGFTPVAPAFADSGMVQTGGGLAGGLTLRTNADAPIYFATASTRENLRLSSAGLIVNNGEVDLDTRIAAASITNAVLVKGDTGRVGVQVASPDAQLSIDQPGGLTAIPTLKLDQANTAKALIELTVSGLDADMILLQLGVSGAPKLSWDESGDNLNWNKKLIIDPTGTGDAADAPLHVYSASAGVISFNSGADDFIVEGSPAPGVSFAAPDLSIFTLAFANPSNPLAAQLTWNYTAGTMILETQKAGATLALGGGAGVTGLTVQSAGEIDIIEYLRHLGDTDNHLRFQTDQQTRVVGGVAFEDFVEGADDYVNFFPSVAGRVGVGLTGNPIGILDVQQPASTFSLIVGADVSAQSRTDATRKFSRVGMPHYENAEEPISLLTGDSNGTANIAFIGGGTSAGNAATTVVIYTAANDTTITGSERLRVASNGNVGIGANSPGSLLELNLATEDLEIVDAGSAAATEQDWIEVEVAGVTGYIRVFAAK